MEIDFIAEARKAAATIKAGGIFTAHRDLLVAAFTAELRKELRGAKIVFSPRVGNGAVGMDILAR